jgi:hypothetical protein
MFNATQLTIPFSQCCFDIKANLILFLCPILFSGKMTFGDESQSSPRTKSYQYPPPPPPPPNRLRTFCPDCKLPERPQRSCLAPEKETTLQRRQPKVVTWQHGSQPASLNGNHSNGLEPCNHDMDPWEQRQPSTGESMIV